MVLGKALVFGFAVFGADNAASSELRALECVDALCWFGLL